ncbi:MAG: hypothetical protein OSB00_10925, partial [Sphingomonas bacterium]|nr:hypothetical protein [Sphingomonas bacterium]
MSSQTEPTANQAQNDDRTDVKEEHRRGQSAATSATSETSAKADVASPQLVLRAPKVSSDAPTAVTGATSEARSHPPAAAHGAAAGRSDTKVNQTKAPDAPNVTGKADATEVIRDADHGSVPVALEDRS